MRKIIFALALLCLFIHVNCCLAASPVSIGLSQIEKSSSELSNVFTGAYTQAPAAEEAAPQKSENTSEEVFGATPPKSNIAPAENSPSTTESALSPSSQENFTILQQDSGTNLTKMNITFSISPAYSWSQAVKFTAPKPNWNLAYILVMATDGWNETSGKLPEPLPFSIDIRDADLALLYHYEGTQLPYFTNSRGIRMATIDLPPIPLNGDFYVCFNGYGSISLAAELENISDSSYYYDGRTAELYSGVLQMRNSQTIPVNWLIRALGK